MARLQRQGRGASPGPSRTTTDATDTPKPSGRDGEKLTGTCPLCDGDGKLTVERRYTPGASPYWVNCWNAQCRSLGGEWLGQVAAIVGAPGGWHILEEPLVWLAHCLGEPRTPGPPAALPSEEQVTEYVDALGNNRVALAYLKGRGLTKSTCRRSRLGFDSRENAIVLSVYAEGELVNVRRRYLAPGHQPKYKGEYGWPAALYPGPPTGDARSVIVCSGEFDALVTAQNTGITTCTSTAGAGHWDEAWSVHFRKRHVAVVFDRNEYASARKVAAALRTAKVDAWPVDISPLLAEGASDLSDFWQAGGTRDELIAHIRQAREAS
jgi:hypothetical protein